MSLDIYDIAYELFKIRKLNTFSADNCDIMMCAGLECSDCPVNTEECCHLYAFDYQISRGYITQEDFKKFLDKYPEVRTVL